MGQNYSQLTDGERNQFYALRKAKMPMTEIANQLGRSRATLYNELARNTCLWRGLLYRLLLSA
ncbi:MAG: helix-turn-helix domain-containing protein [Sedimentisphaerales bacterium]|nr:helix-turn-helix domain-containing protein [Sedimentisphaerales bacterium]